MEAGPLPGNGAQFRPQGPGGAGVLPGANSWTEEVEQIARRVVREARAAAWSHGRAAARAKARENALNITIGALGGFVGTAGLVSIWGGGSPGWLRAVEAVVGFLVCIATVVLGTLRFGEAARGGVVAQAGFSALAHGLVFQLAQPREARADARIFMQARLGEFEELRAAAPLLSPGALRAQENRLRAGAALSEPAWGGASPPGRWVRQPSESDSSEGDADGGRPPDPEPPGPAPPGPLSAAALPSPAPPLGPVPPPASLGFLLAAAARAHARPPPAAVPRSAASGGVSPRSPAADPGGP